ncbi:uncharacterized protein RSE6_03235 [Rhynchosporium secalis]|uniref:Uncharacterized protein n=1 Tax=Rhynchosporium secalis TaxID=38038 RepID=A0A1E1M294_RHYSE|nr:uncharacterized protein RSE6_03235 [Rhynchosporium secalis]
MSTSGVQYFTKKARLLVNKGFVPSAEEDAELQYRLTVPFRTCIETKSAKKELKYIKKAYASDVKKIISIALYHKSKALRLDESSGYHSSIEHADSHESPESEYASPERGSQKRKRLSKENTSAPAVKCQKKVVLRYYVKSAGIEHKMKLIALMQGMNALCVRYNGPDSTVFPPAEFKRNRQDLQTRKAAAADTSRNFEIMPLSEREGLYKTRMTRKIMSMVATWNFGAKNSNPHLRSEREEESPLFGQQKQSSLQYLESCVEQWPFLVYVQLVHRRWPNIEYLDAIARTTFAWTTSITNEILNPSFTLEELRLHRPHINHPSLTTAANQLRDQDSEWKAWTNVKGASQLAGEVVETQRKISRMARAVQDRLPGRPLPEQLPCLTAVPIRMRAVGVRSNAGSHPSSAFMGGLQRSDSLSLKMHSLQIGRTPLRHVEVVA